MFRSRISWLDVRALDLVSFGHTVRCVRFLLLQVLFFSLFLLLQVLHRARPRMNDNPPPFDQKATPLDSIPPGQTLGRSVAF